MRGAEGNGRLQATVENTETASSRIEVDAVVTLLGFISHLGPITDGPEFENKRQTAPQHGDEPAGVMHGDVAGYEGKITLITVGFSEAALAANHAVAHIRGEKAQPKYSTE